MELPLAPIPTAPTAGTPPTAEMTLGAIAAINPAAIPVFERLGLDYCCGGRRTLAQACDAADLSAPAVLAMLTAPRQPDATIPRERSWADASMTELADHIEHTHHAFVRDATVRLRTIMPRVLASHAKSDPRLERLSAVVIEFLADMADHMVREERVLFPWLRRLEKPTDITSGPPWSVRRPVECMIHDHDAAGEHLAEMRDRKSVV